MGETKPKTIRFVLVTVGLLGFFLIADLLGASSSSDWCLRNSDNFVRPHTVHANMSSLDIPNKLLAHRSTISTHRCYIFHATETTYYGDDFLEFHPIPSNNKTPELKWEKMLPAPVPRLDGAALQIRNLLLCIYWIWNHQLFVHSHVDIYNFTDNTWGGRFDMPKEMAHSHLGMVTDGRYIYVVTGQFGSQCRGPTAHTFILDTDTKQWGGTCHLYRFQGYASATQLWRGRLHVMGGSEENRHTLASEHWSIAVKDGKVLEKEWKPEIPFLVVGLTRLSAFPFQKFT
ncbi:hypothetical protein OROGR_028803 [Orobanche gracilis]